jgi:hypothetical protein
VISRRRLVMTVLAVCVTSCYAGFTLLGGLCRRTETAVALGVLGHPGWVTALSVTTHLSRRPGQTLHIPFSTYSSRFLVEAGRGPVQVTFSTYSSSLIALMAVACCGLCIVRAPRPRRYGAVAISVAVVVLCSSLRLASSFWLVHLIGSPVSWLFEDWFGIFLVLVYTAIGYHLLIWLLLPVRRPK